MTLMNEIGIGATVPLTASWPPEEIADAWPLSANPPPAPRTVNSLTVRVSVAVSYMADSLKASSATGATPNWGALKTVPLPSSSAVHTDWPAPA